MFGLSSMSRLMTRLILVERSAFSPNFVRSFSEATESTAKAIDTQKPVPRKAVGGEQGQKSIGKATNVQEGLAAVGKASETIRRDARRKRGPNSVFVAGIPMEAGENELYNLFSKVGPVVRLIRPYNQKTGMYRYFAFCDFVDENGAKMAKEKLNGHEMYGKKLIVTD